MKSFLLMLLGSVMVTSLWGQSPAQSKFTTATYTVKGNCDMCKQRIEAAAKGVGVKKAVWNPQTGKLDLTFVTAKTTANEVLKRIADAGHENELHPANEKAYAALPGCCQYRKSPKH